MITRCLCHSWFSFSSMSHVQRYTVMSAVWFPEDPGPGRFCPSILQKDSASSRPDSKSTMSKSWGVRLLGCLPALVACCTLLVCVHEHLLEGTRGHKQLSYLRVCPGRKAHWVGKAEPHRQHFRVQMASRPCGCDSAGPLPVFAT